MKTDLLRRLFLANVPLSLVAWFGLRIFLQDDFIKDRTISLWNTYDWGGFSLSLMALVPLVYVLTTGGVIHAWSSPTLILLLILGLTGLTAFLFYEALFATRPMIPLRIFKDLTASSGYISAWLQAVLIWAIGYYLVLYVCYSQMKRLNQTNPNSLKSSVSHWSKRDTASI